MTDRLESKQKKLAKQIENLIKRQNQVGGAGDELIIAGINTCRRSQTKPVLAVRGVAG